MRKYAKGILGKGNIGSFAITYSISFIRKDKVFIMEKNVLVIMAAGLGSRFGGIKQLTPVGPSGEIIMEYSIFDAIKAGFKKVIFIIRKDIETDFKEMIGNRISRYIDTEYVCQDIDDLPKGFIKPEGRTKPWGTGQAVLTCFSKISSPFVVINADDYYGKEGFEKIYNFLNHPIHTEKKHNCCMAGFTLGNTLSEFGAVTRGICKVNSLNQLLDIKETHNIQKENDVAFYVDNDEKKYLDTKSIVSMNIWGFFPSILEELTISFEHFLTNLDKTSDPLKAEFLLPEFIEKLLKENKIDVNVLESHDRWFGITYQEDKAFVIRSFQKLVEKGIYPEKLFL